MSRSWLPRCRPLDVIEHARAGPRSTRAEGPSRAGRCALVGSVLSGPDSFEAWRWASRRSVPGRNGTPGDGRAVAARDGDARWCRALRRVRASVPGATGPGRHLRRPREPRRRALLDRVRRGGRRRRGPDREEAALPRRAGDAGLLARDAPAARSTASSARTGRSPRGRASGVRPPARHAAAGPGRGRRASARGAGSIAYTYVEPTVFLEYALAIGTPGSCGGPAQPVRHRWLCDTGGDRPARHGPRRGERRPEGVQRRRSTGDAAGRDSTTSSRRSRRTVAPGVWLEVTTLVIPGENDDPGELRELTAWLVDHLGVETPWHVSRFFPAFRMQDRPADAARDAPPCRRDRPRGGPAPRLRRQRAGAGHGGHPLRRV